MLWVIVHNSSAQMMRQDEHSSAVYIRALDVFLGTGWMGVQLFFLLSGYLITLILIRSRGQPRALPTFFIRRILRIFPVYFLMLGIFVVSLPALSRIMPEWALEIREHAFWYWTYSTNWIQPFLNDKGLPHLWSLAVEEQFYLLWPFLVLYLPRRFLPVVFVAFIAIATVSRTALLTGSAPWMQSAAYLWTTSRLDALAAGGVLAWLASRGNLPSLRIARAIFWAGTAAVLFVILVSHEFLSSSGGVQLFNQSLAIVMFFGLIARVLREDSALYLRWLRHPAAVWIGRVSFAMYLFHLPIFRLWFKVNPLPTQHLADGARFAAIVANFMAVALMSVVLASLSWIAFERPVLRLKRHFRYVDRG